MLLIRKLHDNLMQNDIDSNLIETVIFAFLVYSIELKWILATENTFWFDERIERRSHWLWKCRNVWQKWEISFHSYSHCYWNICVSVMLDAQKSFPQFFPPFVQFSLEKRLRERSESSIQCSFSSSISHSSSYIHINCKHAYKHRMFCIAFLVS